MTKPVFLYATGTAFFAKILGVEFGETFGQATATTWGGKQFHWTGSVDDDPFWRILDPQVWDSRKVNYPAVTVPGGQSIDKGVSMTVAQINALPSGTPFCLGGYSQGAAVMSKVYRLLTGGSLSSRRSSFKGGVLFGNPMRQTDFLAPGVTWSGAWDVPGSTTGGSGTFPDRLSNCEYGLWREYNNVNEIVSSTGTSAKGSALRELVGVAAGMSNPVQSLLAVLNPLWVLALGDALAVGDYGHVRYPFTPPMSTVGQSFSAGTSTSYDLALTFLGEVATDLSAGPILPITHPSMNFPWTTARTFPKNRIILYTCDGTASPGPTLGWQQQKDGGGGYAASMAQALDPNIFEWRPVDYKPGFLLGGILPINDSGLGPGFTTDASRISLPMRRSVDRGVKMIVDQVKQQPIGVKWAMSGLSQGSAITAAVYKEALQGELQPWYDDLIAVVEFGAVCRPQGRTINMAGAINPGGHGMFNFPINYSFGTQNGLLPSNLPTYYWQFANLGDPASIVSGASGTTLSSAVNLWYNFNGISLINFSSQVAALLTSPTAQADLAAIMRVADIFALDPANNPNPHAQYHLPYTGLPNNSLSAVQLAINYMQSVGANWLATYVQPSGGYRPAP